MRREIGDVVVGDDIARDRQADGPCRRQDWWEDLALDGH